MNFSTFGLDPRLLKAVEEQGYRDPTPIQAKAIPVVLSGKDLIAAAQTGTGKTAAFVLPLVQRLVEMGGNPDIARSRQAPQALVLVPTRELAAQVNASVKNYSQYTECRSVVLFGGVGLQPQIDALRRGADIVIATPGRLLDLISQGEARLGEVKLLVLDEADRMLDMGFIKDIKRILSVLPKVRQNLLFSATYSPEIRQLAAGFMRQPVNVEVAPPNTTAARVEQQVYMVNKEHKQNLLMHLINKSEKGQTLVFTRTKHGANKLAKQLEQAGLTVAAIHGNKSQSARTKALGDFKEDRIQILVATDIAARGLDIVDLPCVVNYDLPEVPADYVHRIGRTGRAGAGGRAISLVTTEESSRLKEIERLLGQKIVRGSMPGEMVDFSSVIPFEIKQNQPNRANAHSDRKPMDRSGKSGTRHRTF